MDFSDVIKKRKSIRKFKPQEVEEEKIKKRNNLNTYNVVHYYRALSYEEQGNKIEAIAALENIITHTHDTQWTKVAKQRIKELSE